MKKTKVLFETKPFGPVRVMGIQKRVTLKTNAAKAFWDEAMSGGMIEALQALPGRISADGDLAGWMGEYDDKDKTFTYMIGIFAKPNAPVPEGFVYRDLPACQMGIGRICGYTQNLMQGAHNKTVKAMRANGMEPDYSQGYSMEYYPYKEYAAIEDNGENKIEFHYYVPCK